MLIPEILPSARKHGISDEDMMHAFRNAIAVFDLDELLMTIGPSTTGQLIEVGFIADNGRNYIIHAMNARKKFLGNL